jgi:hypothetical protein
VTFPFIKLDWPAEYFLQADLKAEAMTTVNNIDAGFASAIAAFS